MGFKGQRHRQKQKRDVLVCSIIDNFLYLSTIHPCNIILSGIQRRQKKTSGNTASALNKLPQFFVIPKRWAYMTTNTARQKQDGLQWASLQPASYWSCITHSGKKQEIPQRFVWSQTEKQPEKNVNNIYQVNNMKKEYDFSGAQRGRFFRKGLKLNIPVYLNKETFPFVEELAQRKKSDISSVVNELLKNDIQLVGMLK